MNEEEIAKFEQLKKLIEKDNTKSKEEALSLLKDIEIRYNRLTKSSTMQIEELEMEKEILLKNYIDKDKKLDEAIRAGKDKSLIYRTLRKVKNSLKKVVKK